MKLPHIVATPRDYNSNTLRIASAFLESLQSQYSDLSVEVLDLFNRDLPAVVGENIEAKYMLSMGTPIDKKHEAS